MPENPNPYLDPNMDPNGYMPNNGQMGYVDETNPYMQQGNWNQDNLAGVQGEQGFPDAMQGMGYPNDYISPGNMMSAQDIYANQAAQMNGAMPPMGAMPVDYQNMGDMQGMSPYPDGIGYSPDVYADQGYMQGAGMYPEEGIYADQQYGAGVQAPYQFNEYGQPVVPQPDAGMPYEQFGTPDMQQPYMGADAQGMPVVMPEQAHQNTQMPNAGAEPQQMAGMPQQNTPDASGAFAAQQTQQGVPPKQPQQQPQQQPNQPQGAAQQNAQGRQPSRQPSAPRRPMGPPVDPAKARPGRAKMALVLSIFSIILSLLGPVGFIFALIAFNMSGSYKRNGGTSGAGDAARVFSIAGLIFSCLMIALIVWFVGYYMGYAEWAVNFVNPITFFNNSPIGSIISIPVPST